MIDVYKERLAKNDWLTPETREKAIVKLNVIKPYIGYPEELPARYKDKVVDESASLFENALAFARVEIKHSWSKWNQPVDYKEWGMPAHMVNAYYNPQKNLIVFPAAILQAPFYDLHQSSSANYGGIGAVIAHEISHAFDTNGASFDENGSLKDWWTESDYAAFKEKTQKVIDQFDGQESYGAKINGKLTVSENVADLGGIAAALEAAKREPDFSAEEFFHNFARIWRMKGRPELMKLMASVDVHAPAKLRVNVQVPNFDDFFTTYDVKEGDGMWRSPEDRVIIGKTKTKGIILGFCLLEKGIEGLFVRDSCSWTMSRIDIVVRKGEELRLNAMEELFRATCRKVCPSDGFSEKSISGQDKMGIRKDDRNTADRVPWGW